jgi:FMN hydrolase / 5-amino-6-(5-phospho-D-ribitylamino)uracil phosphatase
MTPQRWVGLDVGETLIDESRVWATWAQALGSTPFTIMSAIGATIARGDWYDRAFEMLRRPDWRTLEAEVRERYGGFRTEDLYPDALPTIEGLRRAGFRVAVVGNQPASRTAELRALGVEAEVIAMSEELGVSKPDPAFFRRALELMGNPDPGDVAYVGDRLDNDVRVSAATGLHSVWIRRGPWGVIPKAPVPRATLVIDTLTELLEHIDEIWPDA